MVKKYSIVNRFAFLKQVPIFSKLNWFGLQKIARKADFVDYKKGELVCKQGESADAFYCLVSGRIQSYARTAEGKAIDYRIFFYHFIL